MSDYLSTELAATCAALGYYDGSKYHLDNYCLGKSSCYFFMCILYTKYSWVSQTWIHRYKEILLKLLIS